MPRVCLITGATGKQGGAAIQHLLEHNQELRDSSNEDPTVVRFLTRSQTSSKAIHLQQQGNNAYEGNLLDPDSLAIALDGVDAAFLVTDFSGKGGTETEVKQGRTFVDAAKKAGVKHLVFTSVCGADEAASVPHFHSKFQIENYLKESGLGYTILRPVAFMDNFPAEPSFVLSLALGAFYAMAGWRDVQLVSCDDIGAVASKALLDPEAKEFKNKTIDLSAGAYTADNALDAYEKVHGARPWIASWFPSWFVYLIPYDFKQMMFYFRNPGYPKVDIQGLKKIQPGLQSMQDYVASKSGKLKQQ